MKVNVVPSYRDNKEFTVELSQGHQYFRLDYSGNKGEARFMAKMFRLALSRHNAEYQSIAKPAPKKRKKSATVSPISSEGPAA